MSGTNAQLMTQLRQGENDLVLGRIVQALTMADLSFEQLYSEPLRMVVRPGHPLAVRPTPTLDSLASFPFVLPVPGTLIRHTADAFLLSGGMAPPRCLVEATDNSFVMGLLRLTDAVWFAPQGAVEGPLKRGELALLAFGTAVTEGAVGFTVRRNDEISEGARRLIDMIRTLVKDWELARPESLLERL